MPKDGSSPRATNPVDWLKFLGQWYRQSGRSAPLMDGLDIHPYPVPQNLPFEKGYNDPTSFSVTNLARVYQAFFTAFQGTGQKTVGPGRLPVSLNEVGIQTIPGAAVAGKYTGAENGEGVSSTGGEELPGDLVLEARRLRALRRGHHEGEHLQARRRDGARGLAERALLSGLRRQAVGGRLQGRAREDGRALPVGTGEVLQPGRHTRRQAPAGEEARRQEARGQEAGGQEEGRQERS